MFSAATDKQICGCHPPPNPPFSLGFATSICTLPPFLLDSSEFIKRKRRVFAVSAVHRFTAGMLTGLSAIQKLKIKIYRTIILPVVLYGCEAWSLTLREERRLRVFENRVLRRVFGPKRDEVTGEWRKLHN